VARRNLQTAYEDFEREKLLERLCSRRGGLFVLATEYLGYDLLTEEFHGPICQWMMDHEGDPFNWFAAARDHYKTTLQIADICRWGLKWPERTHLLLHAVESEEKATLQEVGHHFIRNDKFRVLRPEIMPDKRSKRALTASSLRLRGLESYNRAPFLAAKSTGSEITGKHITGSIRPDDIIARNTIEDSGLPKVKSWWRNTVMPVRRPSCIVMGSGTRWDVDDIYGDWLSDPDWNTLVRACRETDGVPDYKGKSVGVYTEKELRLRERQMGTHDFAFQMMNDPSPAGEKPWDPSCENYIGLEARDGYPGVGGFRDGATFILSDPAPAKEGSATQDTEKARADGSKDDWALAAVKIKYHHDLQIAILLDIRTSKKWTRSKGLDEACRLMRKWRTNKFFNESYGGLIADYTPEMKKAALRNGVELYRDKNGQLPAFKQTGKNPKNRRFGTLCDWGRTGRFYICKESVPEAELQKFLEQSRGWRPLPNGRNTLRFDDSADCVARCTDSALQRWVPPPVVESSDGWSPYKRPKLDEEYAYAGRYISW